MADPRDLHREIGEIREPIFASELAELPVDMATAVRFRFGHSSEQRGGMMRATKRNARVARRLYRLCLVDGLLDESRAHLVVNRIVHARRRGGVAVLSHFRRLVTLDVDRHTAHVESAVPLPDDLRARVESGVATSFGRGVTAEFRENADLIGGMRLRVGSQVYDGSVQGRLAAIAARL